jgi:hypothetical protein
LEGIQSRADVDAEDGRHVAHADVGLDDENMLGNGHMSMSDIKEERGARHTVVDVGNGNVLLHRHDDGHMSVSDVKQRGARHVDADAGGQHLLLHSSVELMKLERGLCADVDAHGRGMTHSDVSNRDALGHDMAHSDVCRMMEEKGIHADVGVHGHDMERSDVVSRDAHGDVMTHNDVSNIMEERGICAEVDVHGDFESEECGNACDTPRAHAC